MSREQRSLDLRAIERPSMTGTRDDLDLARALGAVRCEQVANPYPGPELLAPPPAGAVEHRRHLVSGQILDLRIRELGRARDRPGEPEPPVGRADRRYRIEGP